MCLYVYRGVCVCVCACVYVCVGRGVYLHVCRCVCVGVCVCRGVYLHICRCVCVGVCMCRWVCVCFCLWSWRPSPGFILLGKCCTAGHMPALVLETPSDFVHVTWGDMTPDGYVSY